MPHMPARLHDWKLPHGSARIPCQTLWCCSEPCTAGCVLPLGTGKRCRFATVVQTLHLCIEHAMYRPSTAFLTLFSTGLRTGRREGNFSLLIALTLTLCSLHHQCLDLFFSDSRQTSSWGRLSCKETQSENPVSVFHPWSSLAKTL